MSPPCHLHVTAAHCKPYPSTAPSPPTRAGRYPYAIVRWLAVGVGDGFSGSSEGTLSVEVTPVNDAPTPNNSHVPDAYMGLARLITVQGSYVDGANPLNSIADCRWPK